MEKINNPKINDFLARGIEHIYPTPDEFSARLGESQPLKIYWGIDPTGPTLHLGHLSVMLKLKQLQDLGSGVVILIGDFTAQIGDPTDKGEARRILTHEQVLANCRLYKKQISRILDLKKIKFVYNSQWLKKLNFSQVVEISSEFTLGQMVERDMFQERIKASKPIFLHEFLYPLMQGYDSVQLGVDAEIGGNDQTFNMLAGRDLMRKMLGKEKYVMTVPLLTDNRGVKIGKTEGNVIALTDAANDFYAKIMSLGDDSIVACFTLLTNMPEAEIEQMKQMMVKWVLGAPNPLPTCESVGAIVNSTPIDNPDSPGDDIICDIKIATGACVKREWLWAVGAYCCAVDRATGQTPGSYCTTDPWVQQVSQVEEIACE